MAEALAVIGTIGAVCNIVDVIGKTISMISDVQSKWKTADLALLSLASQLTALRAALMEIQKWLENNSETMHHQLIMDLDVSLSCCQLLAAELDGVFTRLKTSTDNPLSPVGKLKIIINGQGTNDIQRFIKHQMSALNLLLTACNCTSLSEQRRLLEKTKTRKALARAKSDSVSLLVHRDSASFVSKFTDNLSKLSYVFEFDSTVLSTRVYERVFRLSLKQSVKQQQVKPMPRPNQHVLLLGAQLFPKILITSKLFQSHSIDANEEATLLAKRSLSFQQACVELTLEAIRKLCTDVYNPFRTFQMANLADESLANNLGTRCLHIIISFWFLPDFASYLGKVIANTNSNVDSVGRLEAKESATYILARTIHNGTNPQPSQPIVKVSDLNILGRACSTTFRPTYLDFDHNTHPSFTLVSVWDADTSFLRRFHEDHTPPIIFYISDLDTQSGESQLQFSTFAQDVGYLSKLIRIRLILIFVASSNALGSVYTKYIPWHVQEIEDSFTGYFRHVLLPSFADLDGVMQSTLSGTSDEEAWIASSGTLEHSPPKPPGER